MASLLTRGGSLGGRLSKLGLRGALRSLSDSAAKIEERYSRPLAAAHWATAAAFIATVVSVKAAQNTKDKKQKGKLMRFHKSTALVVSGLVAPRIALRAASAIPSHLPLGSPFSAWAEKFVVNASHTALYAALLVMPLTGIGMGYYGGKGVPFYGIWTLPGKSANRTKEDGKFAGRLFGWHKSAGQVVPLVIGAHVAGASVHSLKGQAIFTRISPF